MKLYEFTVTDEFNLPEDQVIQEVMQSLGDHPHSSDWVSGYQLKQCQSPEQLSNSTKRYFFEVWGDLESGSDRETGSSSVPQKRSSHGNAAKEADL